MSRRHVINQSSCWFNV